MNLRYRINRHLSNAPGFRTKRKVLVIESDDWGSIRMPSVDVFERLESTGLDLRSRDAERYNLYDNLASERDLEELFNVLLSFRDSNGKNPVFTAVSVVANPDFKKIEENDFEEYFYEPFTETLNRYKGCENSFLLWKKGIENNIFIPQMHGREHLNITAWLKSLKQGDLATRQAFKEQMWGFVPNQKEMPGIYFQPAFLPYDMAELELHKTIIQNGLELFETIFGYKAEYFVPPNGHFNNSLNKTLFQGGIRFRSSSKIQSEPQGNRKYRKVFHWLGQKDSSGISYITRNCFFEPSSLKRDWIDSCLSDINIAFKWNKPAIISSHRVNYIGSNYIDNRERGLQQLKILLTEIIKNWPDIEFMSTNQLGYFFK